MYNDITCVSRIITKSRLARGWIQTEITRGSAIFKGHTLILIKYLFGYIHMLFSTVSYRTKHIFYSNSNKKIYHYNFVILEVITSKTKIRDFKLFFFQRTRGWAIALFARLDLPLHPYYKYSYLECQR